MECVIFDIGGVLIDQDLSLLARQLSARTGQAADLILALFGKDVVRDVETGKVSPEGYFDSTIAPQLPGLSYEDWIGAWMSNYEINPLAWELLEAAREGGRTVCILSNLSEFNKTAIDRKFPHFFAAVHRRFLSYELGLHKPDPAIYRAVCEQLGIAPARCLFVDDVEENVEGARKAGMASIQYGGDHVEEIRSVLGGSSRRSA